jgi:hypothetical protein
MIQTTFNAQTVYVLNDFWNGNADFQMDIALIRDTETGLTKREARRPYSLTLRVPKVRYAATVSDASLRTLQASLRALSTQPVILPLWPVVTRWADRAGACVSGGLKVAFKDDWSQFEIYTTVEPSWPSDDDNFAPALMGFISPNAANFINADAEKWPVEFSESSPAAYALQPVAFTAPAGPQPTGYSTAPALLPFYPDFQSITEEISVDIKRAQIGFTREQMTTFYPQAAARSQLASYRLTSSQAGQFIRFFQDIAAPGSAFWASGWTQIAQLTQDSIAANSVLTVEDTSAVLVGDYVWLYQHENATARKISAKTVNTITLDNNVGFALTVGDALILPLSLARLDKPKLTLSWRSAESVSLSLAWTEVPAELTIPTDETLGVTTGKLSTRVILYQFIRDYRNGTVVNYYFTSFEQDLSWNGQTWLYRKIDAGDISRGLNLEDDGVDVTTENFSGNPLLDDVQKVAEVPLQLVIRTADFDGTTVSNVKTEFSGLVLSAYPQGRSIVAKCRFGPAVLDNQLPFFIKGASCNNLRGSNDGTFLISAGCTLLKSDWKFTAQVAGPVVSDWPFAISLTSLARVTGSAPTFFANWFAGGVIEWGTGANVQRRLIATSTNPVSGALTIKLHRYFKSLPTIGNTVVLYPGCDGMFATCKAYDGSANPTGKFDNKTNFFALPFMPIGNPSLTGQPNLGTRGGKK